VKKELKKSKNGRFECMQGSVAHRTAAVVINLGLAKGSRD